MGEHDQNQEHVAEPARPPLSTAQAREMTAGLRAAMDDVRRSVALLAARARDAHAARARYAGKRTAVIGSGASAFTALAYLAKSGDGAGTKEVWILRRGISGSTFGGGTADQPPARGALGLAAKAAVDEGHADAVTGFRTEAIERADDGRLILVGEDGRRLDPVDEVIVLTGFRPDLTFLNELRLGLDERLQAPLALAPLIDPNQHSCGTVCPHDHRELSHPEQGVYLVGMKSYGRAPTFLAMTGYEQVRSVAAAIAGDLHAADRVELTLPETGVWAPACSTLPTPRRVIATAAVAALPRRSSSSSAPPPQPGRLPISPRQAAAAAHDQPGRINSRGRDRRRTGRSPAPPCPPSAPRRS